MKNYLVECIGTFFLVFVIGLCVLDPGVGAMAPLAIGTILMVMVYAGGYISGGHYNPAVTLGVWMRGKCKTKDVPFYMIAQIIGAIVASLLVVRLKGNVPVVATTATGLRIFVCELIFTFALVYVVLTTATSAKTAGNSYYGLAIGFTLMAAAYSIGSISGCAINPAVAIGITIMKLSAISKLGVLIAANLCGGAIAAVIFKMVNSEE